MGINVRNLNVKKMPEQIAFHPVSHNGTSVTVLTVFRHGKEATLPLDNARSEHNRFFVEAHERVRLVSLAAFRSQQHNVGELETQLCMP
jgi:hypothetical protein